LYINALCNEIISMPYSCDLILLLTRVTNIVTSLRFSRRNTIGQDGRGFTSSEQENDETEGHEIIKTTRVPNDHLESMPLKTRTRDEIVQDINTFSPSSELENDETEGHEIIETTRVPNDHLESMPLRTQTLVAIGQDGRRFPPSPKLENIETEPSGDTEICVGQTPMFDSYLKSEFLIP
jgi:hypothetical protein